MNSLKSTITKPSICGILQSYPKRVSSFSKVNYVSLPNFVTNSITTNILSYMSFEDNYNDEEEKWDEDYYNDFY